MRGKAAMNGLTQPTFIPVCCVCGFAREGGDSADSSTEWWSDFDAYLQRHGLREAEYRLTHAYCPVCVQQYMPAKKKSRGGEAHSPTVTDVTAVILHTVRQQRRSDLDALARSCPQLTWNQIFLEVDRMSRAGTLKLTLSDRCRYEVTLPEEQGSGIHLPGAHDSADSDPCEGSGYLAVGHPRKAARRRTPRLQAVSAASEKN